MKNIVFENECMLCGEKIVEVDSALKEEEVVDCEESIVGRKRKKVTGEKEEKVLIPKVEIYWRNVKKCL